MILSFRWIALFVGICPSDGLCRSTCECPQCSADDAEDAALYVFDTRRESAS